MTRRNAMRTMVGAVLAPLVAWWPTRAGANPSLNLARKCVSSDAMIAKRGNVRTFVCDHPDLGVVEVDVRIGFPKGSRTVKYIDGKMAVLMTVDAEVIETRVNGRVFPDQSSLT